MLEVKGKCTCEDEVFRLCEAYELDVEILCVVVIFCVMDLAFRVHLGCFPIVGLDADSDDFEWGMFVGTH